MQIQLATESENSPSAAGDGIAEVSAVVGQSAYPERGVFRREDAVACFDRDRISVAMAQAFPAVEGGQGAGSARIGELISEFIAGVVATLVRLGKALGTARDLKSGYLGPQTLMLKLTDLKEGRKFFETRVIEYQIGGAPNLGIARFILFASGGGKNG